MESEPDAELPDLHWTTLDKRISYQVNHFPGIAGVVVKDLRRGWTIEYNAEELFPSASLIKIPLMASVFHAQSEGKVSLDQFMKIERRLKSGGSGRLRLARAGTLVSVRELMYKMITESDNTATNVLSDYLGLPYCDSHFQSLGLNHTNFSRMVMDLRKRDRGIENFTTPRDMAKILEMIYNKRLTGSDEMLEILKGQKINDRLARGIPRGWTIGHKTGLMRSTVHDVGIVFAPSSDYLICVLTKNIRSYKKAKHFIAEVSHITANYYGELSYHPRPKQSFWSKVFGKSGKAG